MSYELGAFVVGLLATYAWVVWYTHRTYKVIIAEQVAMLDEHRKFMADIDATLLQDSKPFKGWD